MRHDAAMDDPAHTGSLPTPAQVQAARDGPSVGEGVDLRLSGPKVAGGALVRGGPVVHAELFRVEA